MSSPIRQLTVEGQQALDRLAARLQAAELEVGVIGLGYVGIPLAACLAQAGSRVVGVDLDPTRAAAVAEGKLPLGGDEPGLAELLAEVVGEGRLSATTDYEKLAAADVVLIAVETPIDDRHAPDYGALEGAIESVGAVLKPGALVIIESTLAPGTIDGLVAPGLERATGRSLNQDYFLGHCPERVMPGRLLRNLRSMNRVCGASHPAVANFMVAFYQRFVDGELDPTDCLTAELVKTAENAYRDVNIAFANELALICEAVGGDVWQVRDLVNKSPGRNVLLPGGGVGGHCIPKDPWLLASSAIERGVEPRLITAARWVNDGMPTHVASLLAKAGVEPPAPILILGYSYLEESGDVRNSPSARLMQLLEAAGFQVRIHDPFVPPYDNDLEAKLSWASAAVLMVKHQAYQNLPPRPLQHLILIDTRFALHAQRTRFRGYSRLGDGGRQPETESPGPA